MPGGDAAMPVEGTYAAIPRWPGWRRPSGSGGFPVHAIRLHRADGSNVGLVRRRSIERGARIALPGSAGSQIAAEVLPRADELDYELLLAGGCQQIGPAEHVM